MTTNYNKNHYLKLLKQRSISQISKQDESKLLTYSCMLEAQLEWEIRGQFLELMQEVLREDISMPEFFAELQTLNYSIIDAVPFLESHKIILSLDKKAVKFSELLEEVFDSLEGDLEFTGDEFDNWIRENFIKMKKYIDEN